MRYDGYLVIFNLTDPLTGKVLQRGTVQEVRDVREPMIVNGAEWTRTVCSKHADPDIPILKEAEAEYAKLQ